jgi:hypothetical protein
MCSSHLQHRHILLLVLCESVNSSLLLVMYLHLHSACGYDSYYYYYYYSHYYHYCYYKLCILCIMLT